MLPRRIILLRHGLSEANLDSGVYAKVPDHLISLTEDGVREAREAGERIRSLIGDSSFGIFTSPYRRTLQTKDAMLEGGGLVPNFDYQDPSLREQEYGNMPSDEKSEMSRGLREQIGRFFFRFPDGESCADVYDRMAIFMQSLFRMFNKNLCPENLVIVSHGTAIKCFLTRWYHWPIDKFDKMGLLPNCHISVMTHVEASRNDPQYVLTEPFSNQKYF